MGKNLPQAKLNDTQVVYFLKERQGLFKKAADIASLAREARKKEDDLKCTMGARSSIESLLMVAYPHTDFKEALERSLKTSFDPPARPRAPLKGGQEPNEEDARAKHMTQLFFDCFQADGIAIGNLKLPADDTAKKQLMADCGFADEKEFLRYFYQKFIPQILINVGAFRNIPGPITLNRKLKEQMKTVLGNLGSSDAPKTVAELRTRLANMLNTLPADPAAGNFAVAGNVGTAIPTARAQIQAVLDLTDDELEQRLEIIKALGANNALLGEVDSIKYDDNPTVTAYESEGDLNKKASAPKTLDELREEQGEVEKRIVEELDAVATDNASRTNRVTELKAKEQELRKEIWENRKKEIDYLLALLPNDKYRRLYNEYLKVHNVPELTNVKNIDNFILYFEQLKKVFADNTVAEEKSDTLFVINRLLELAQEIKKEDAAIATVAAGAPVDLNVAPDETTAKAVLALVATDAPERKQKEQALATTEVEVKLEAKQINYGDESGQQGFKSGPEDIKWELERIHLLNELRHPKTTTTATTSASAATGTASASSTLSNITSSAATGAVIGGTAGAFVGGTVAGLVAAGSSGGLAPSNIGSLAAAGAAVVGGAGALAGGAVGGVAGVVSAASSAFSSTSAVPTTTTTALPAPDPLTSVLQADPQIVAIPFAKRNGEDKHKPLVKLVVNLERQQKNTKPTILASRNFALGADGKWLTPAEVREKVMALFMYDTNNDKVKVWKHDGQDTLNGAGKTFVNPNTPLAQSGCDVGDGRLSKYLNDNAAALNLTSPVTNADGSQQKYICMLDEDKNSSVLTVYWATFDKDGKITDKQRLSKSHNEIITDVMAVMLFDGLGEDHKASISLAPGAEANLSKTKTKAGQFFHVIEPAKKAQVKKDEPVTATSGVVSNLWTQTRATNAVVAKSGWGTTLKNFAHSPVKTIRTAFATR